MAVNEFSEGIQDGTYLFVDIGWVVRSQITGNIVALARRDERLWVISFSRETRCWRLQSRVLEGPGMYGQKWFECYNEGIVDGLDAAFAAIDSWRDA